MAKYTIKYEIYLNDNKSILDKEINIDHCSNSLEAQIRLEKYLIKKYDNFKRLVVINCKLFNPINDMFGEVFKDIFKSK